ncbi:Os02g0772600, partial [Oryza sativa Japonica Group]
TSEIVSLSLGSLVCVVGLESPESSSSEASSGYLQDAVAHWSDRCNKRQRMAEAAAPPRRPAAAAANEDLHCLLQSFWDSSSSGGEGGLMHELNIMIPESGIVALKQLRTLFIGQEMRTTHRVGSRSRGARSAQQQQQQHQQCRCQRRREEEEERQLIPSSTTTTPRPPPLAPPPGKALRSNCSCKRQLVQQARATQRQRQGGQGAAAITPARSTRRGTRACCTRLQLSSRWG